jgi:hypothetical protein
MLAAILSLGILLAATADTPLLTYTPKHEELKKAWKEGQVSTPLCSIRIIASGKFNVCNELSGNYRMLRTCGVKI